MDLIYIVNGKYQQKSDGGINDMCKFVLQTFILDFPEIHSISPSTADNSEDFPDPTRPTIATNDPSGMFMSMLKYNQT